mmetsp:Transcript_30914/g.91846  ORF Transcript_30914/g.91846 Transcript_30914/m.91846 type:complete len:323 (+) Transcript_30914:1309-2277(+)
MEHAEFGRRGLCTPAAGRCPKAAPSTDRPLSKPAAVNSAPRFAAAALLWPLPSAPGFPASASSLRAGSAALVSGLRLEAAAAHVRTIWLKDASRISSCGYFGRGRRCLSGAPLGQVERPGGGACCGSDGGGSPSAASEVIRLRQTSSSTRRLKIGSCARLARRLSLRRSVMRLLSGASAARDASRSPFHPRWSSERLRLAVDSAESGDRGGTPIGEPRRLRSSWRVVSSRTPRSASVEVRPTPDALSSVSRGRAASCKACTPPSPSLGFESMRRVASCCRLARLSPGLLLSPLPGCRRLAWIDSVSRAGHPARPRTDPIWLP